MEIRPILSALMRSKVSMILIGLQVALTLAIVTNALFIIGQRLERMDRPSGINEADTFLIGSSGFGQQFDSRVTTQADLDLLRHLPGVVAATPVNTVPMSNSGWNSGLQLTPQRTPSSTNTAFVFIDDHGLDAFGLNLVAGRAFRPEEVVDRTMNDRDLSGPLIVTKALADKLFPDGDALGRNIYLDEGAPPSTIVGIVEKMQQPWVSSTTIEYTTLLPVRMAYGTSRYLVRTEPGRRDEVMNLAEEKLAASNTSRIIRGKRTIEQIRKDAYSGDRAMSIILLTVITALLAITALGIVGMASFWVAQRTKQIGTRRALGATRGDILRYFQTENFIITTLGLLAGGVLAYAFSLWLMQNFNLPKLPWYYVPTGFACLWLLGQLAVLGPALRAARVPPAVATRSV